MKKNTARNDRGASVIELLIVLAITAVLVTFAVSQFGNAQEIFKTQNIARELKVNLERARLDSVKRRPGIPANNARVVIESATKFSTFIDLDRNGLIESTDKKTINLENSGSGRILTNGWNLPITIAFDRRGRITARDSLGNSVTPIVRICNNCTVSTISPQNAFEIAISLTGTVSMYRYGDPQDTLINPTVGNINSNSSINPMVSLVPGSSAPTGTPAPTPTPIGTPTPNPTPTPTPLPGVCLRNERPATSGCICQLPMYVRSSGKCS